MTQEDALQYLQEVLTQMQDAIRWLERSFKQCQSFGIKKEYSADEFDKLENLCSRFGRTTDLIINKVFRSIDKVELEEGGTTIDVVNRAEKRRLIASTDQIREIKDLRNQVVHEYLSEALALLVEDIIKFTPELIQIHKRILDYCQKKFGIGGENTGH